MVIASTTMFSVYALSARTRLLWYSYWDGATSCVVRYVLLRLATGAN